MVTGVVRRWIVVTWRWSHLDTEDAPNFSELRTAIDFTTDPIKGKT